MKSLALDRPRTMLGDVGGELGFVPFKRITLEALLKEQEIA